MDTMAWVSSLAARPGGALKPETRGSLGAFDVVPGSLAPNQSGIHTYLVEGTPGLILQAKVATDTFDPVVVVIAPSGMKWDVSSRVRAPDAGKGGAKEELALPEAGEYKLLVTSRQNVTQGRAVTAGEYRLTLLCDAPEAKAPVPRPTPSSRSGRFGAWESEPR
jgi:hypothetical protein